MNKSNNNKNVKIDNKLSKITDNKINCNNIIKTSNKVHLKSLCCFENEAHSKQVEFVKITTM